jgi:hypothetical protein
MCLEDICTASKDVNVPVPKNTEQEEVLKRERNGLECNKNSSHRMYEKYVSRPSILRRGGRIEGKE